MPDISIRLDPFNWLIYGRLGLELEVEVWEFITVETVPVFVANKHPPSFNMRAREDTLSQESNGWGPLAGASIGAGFWLTGKPFESYFLKAILTNYSYTYKTVDSNDDPLDEVNHVERRFMALFGSQSNFGPFSIVGGIGLSYELNQQERCFPDPVTRLDEVRRDDCDGDFDIALEDPADTTGPLLVYPLNGPLHPIDLEVRFSLGFTF
jgi:hypothetical protein